MSKRHSYVNPTRSAFTLIELLVTLLLISVLLGFGAVALYTSERKASVSDGIHNLVALHEKAMKWQRIAAASKSGSLYQLTIQPLYTPGPPAIYPSASLSNSNLTNVDISGGGAVENVTNAPNSIDYDPATGFPAISSPLKIEFGIHNKKYSRSLIIYPLGFTEDVQ